MFRGRERFLNGVEVEEWRRWVQMCPRVVEGGVCGELKQKSPAGSDGQLELHLGIDGGGGQ